MTLALSKTNARQAANQLSALTDDALDREITLASAKRDIANLEVLTDERLRRTQRLAIFDHKLLLWKQVEDLHHKQANETFREVGYKSFFEYCRARQMELHEFYRAVKENNPNLEDIQIPYSHVIWSWNYKTIEAWLSIYRHYALSHGWKLEALAQYDKGKLERVKHTCVTWDQAHNGEIDPDILAVLSNPNTTHANILDCYEALKARKQLPTDHIEQADGELPFDDVPNDGADDDDSPSDEEDEGLDLNEPFADEVTFSMDSESGEIAAWIPTAGNDERQTMKLIGKFYLADDTRGLVYGLCNQARIRVG